MGKQLIKSEKITTIANAVARSIVGGGSSSPKKGAALARPNDAVKKQIVDVLTGLEGTEEQVNAISNSDNFVRNAIDELTYAFKDSFQEIKDKLPRPKAPNHAVRSVVGGLAGTAGYGAYLTSVVKGIVASFVYNSTVNSTVAESTVTAAANTTLAALQDQFNNYQPYTNFGLMFLSSAALTYATSRAFFSKTPELKFDQAKAVADIVRHQVEVAVEAQAKATSPKVENEGETPEQVTPKAVK